MLQHEPLTKSSTSMPAEQEHPPGSIRTRLVLTFMAVSLLPVLTVGLVLAIASTQANIQGCSNPGEQFLQTSQSNLPILAVIASLAIASVWSAMFTALLVTRSITSPVAALAETAARIARGSLRTDGNLETASEMGSASGSVGDRVEPTAARNAALLSFGSETASLVDIASDDEIGILARAFNSMTFQLQDLIKNLETRVDERTRALERISTQLRAAAEVGRAAATLHTLDELLTTVARLISELFGFYHVGIFLLDDKGEYAILRAANSPGGQRMLARFHRLRVGQQGIVGYVAHTHQPRVVRNVGQDVVYFNNPDLPQTQSEMALPLMFSERILGVLDVQSTVPDGFTEQDLETLQVLADQVSIAINNARLLQQTEVLLEAERRAYREAGEKAWVESTQLLSNLGYIRNTLGLRSIANQPGSSLLSAGQAIDQTQVDHQNLEVLTVPVRVRNQTIAVIKLRRPLDTGGWPEQDIRMIESLADQLGGALESARAYQGTQLAAQRERMLGEVNARIRETLNIETMLKTTVAEIQRALRLSEVVVQLNSPVEPSYGESGSRSLVTNANGNGSHGVQR